MKPAHDYTIIRSNRKTLAMEITPDAKILVRAPQRAALRDIERMVADHREWIDTHMEKQRRRIELRPEPSPEEAAALKARAKAVLPERTAHYAALMGLTPAGITVTGARKRFGSCSPKNRLCFSYHLMRYPDEAVDYVVVHELAHIRHKNHGKAFYALIESILPDYKARRQLLKS
jgi:predicted metal-dependent hydrolase